jgi:hypothetical protein
MKCAQTTSMQSLHRENEYDQTSGASAKKLVLSQRPLRLSVKKIGKEITPQRPRVHRVGNGTLMETDICISDRRQSDVEAQLRSGGLEYVFIRR